MTREEFIKRFQWNKVMWLIGFVNIIALIPQPVAIIRTGVVAGVAWQMFAIFAVVQAVFAIEFFLKKSWSGMVSMSISFCLSILTIVLYFMYS